MRVAGDACNSATYQPQLGYGLAYAVPTIIDVGFFLVAEGAVAEPMIGHDSWGTNEKIMTV